MGIFEQAVANIAYLSAQASGGMSRLNFAADSLSSMETNMRAAIGRIEGVDIAEEKQRISPSSVSLHRRLPPWWLRLTPQMMWP